MNPRVRTGLLVGSVVVVGAVGLRALQHRNTGNKNVPTLAPQNYPMAAEDSGDAGGSPGGSDPYVPYNAEGSSISGFQNRTDLAQSSPTSAATAQATTIDPASQPDPITVAVDQALSPTGTTDTVGSAPNPATNSSVINASLSFLNPSNGYVGPSVMGTRF